MTLEEAVFRARELNKELSMALWNYDSALSLFRKATSGSYRSSEATGDAPWQVEYYRKKLVDAEAAILRLRVL